MRVNKTAPIISKQYNTLNILFFLELHVPGFFFFFTIFIRNILHMNPHIKKITQICCGNIE